MQIYIDPVSLDRPALIALCRELQAENAAMAAMMPSASHGFARLRAFVDPVVPRGQKKDDGREPL